MLGCQSVGPSIAQCGHDDAVGAAHQAKSGKEELEPVTLLLGTSLA